MSDNRRAVKEVTDHDGGTVWHLLDGPMDEAATWQPIRCGGGIIFPGTIQSRPRTDICRDCLRTPPPTAGAVSEIGEHWRPIPDYEERYEVSDHGRVRSHRPGLPPRRILKPGTNLKGYLYVTLSRGNTPWSVCVHRLVMLTFVGPRPPGLQVRHLDGDQLNNRLTNLRYGTPAENRADVILHARRRLHTETETR